eukprot:TRINITY_DN993_c0_g1_i11.p1 TRINITY_DN993_c0_g1~~TRINITY_DN993_c0_g1_i11.p1  ORF type:complete len:450 (-),score=103.02 TRINITY_DN993_c0_g1_i11:284-1633(-)
MDPHVAQLQDRVEKLEAEVQLWRSLMRSVFVKELGSHGTNDAAMHVQPEATNPVVASDPTDRHPIETPLVKSVIRGTPTGTTLSGSTITPNNAPISTPTVKTPSPITETSAPPTEVVGSNSATMPAPAAPVQEKKRPIVPDASDAPTPEIKVFKPIKTEAMSEPSAQASTPIKTEPSPVKPPTPAATASTTASSPTVIPTSTPTLAQQQQPQTSTQSSTSTSTSTSTPTPTPTPTPTQPGTTASLSTMATTPSTSAADTLYPPISSTNWQHEGLALGWKFPDRHRWRMCFSIDGHPKLTVNTGVAPAVRDKSLANVRVVYCKMDNLTAAWSSFFLNRYKDACKRYALPPSPLIVGPAGSLSTKLQLLVRRIAGTKEETSPVEALAFPLRGASLAACKLADAVADVYLYSFRMEETNSELTLIFEKVSEGYLLRAAEFNIASPSVGKTMG